MSVFSKLCTDIVDFGSAKSDKRIENITKITIHHMASVLSGSQCAHNHLDGPQQASANYYVGNSGDICGGVSEDRRAWTSGSRWNDQQAITIEVSNSSVGDPWPVSDSAYTATINLCADICKRYGIRPYYSGDKNGSLTLHCMFQATACPGPTWKSYFDSMKVERDILKALNSLDSKPVSGSTEVVSDEQKIWNYLLNKIGNEYGVAGLMGNLYAESGLRPNNLQNSFEKKLGLNDAQYTAVVDSGTYIRDQFVNDQAGYGLAQWTYWSRKQNLYDYAKSTKRSIGSLDMQLDFLWKELSVNYRGMLPDLQCATSVYDASTAVLLKFERPADQSDNMKQTRAKYGQNYYNKYAKGVKPSPSPSPSGVPYAARIVTDELNVRKGPGTNYEIVQQVYRGSAFTIVEVQGEWGRLKSGVGWINLNYTEKV